MTRRDLLKTAAAAGAAAVAAVETPSVEAEAAADDRATLEMLDRFAAAWNRHDIEGLMACMTPDGVFEASSGRDVAGTRHAGAEAVRKAYLAVFDAYPDGRWNNPRHFVAGNRAVSEWTFTGTTRDGTKVEVNGCDVFTLRDGKIALKNSYRKQRS
ncbi:MAG: nuclear transport factor 2 family protein [Acidobacteriota bacterium]